MELGQAGGAGGSRDAALTGTAQRAPVSSAAAGAMAGGFSEDEIQDLYAWVDTVPLSRPKRNIARDFSDGVLMAETVISSLRSSDSYRAACCCAMPSQQQQQQQMERGITVLDIRAPS